MSRIEPQIKIDQLTDSVVSNIMVRDLVKAVEEEATRDFIKTKPLDLGDKRIVNVAEPTDTNDAATKVYVEKAIVKSTNDARSTVLNMGNQKIIGLASPSSNTDAATKLYVDQALTCVKLQTVTCRSPVVVGTSPTAHTCYFWPGIHLPIGTVISKIHFTSIGGTGASGLHTILDYVFVKLNETLVHTFPHHVEEVVKMPENKSVYFNENPGITISEKGVFFLRLKPATHSKAISPQSSVVTLYY